MITLQEFKDSLGDKSKELTEEQIIKLKNQMEQMADIFFDMWLEDKKIQKPPKSIRITGKNWIEIVFL